MGEAVLFVVVAEAALLHGGGLAAESVGLDVLAAGSGVGVDEFDFCLHEDLLGV